MEDLGIDVILLRDLKEMGWKGADWIPVALDTPIVVQKYAMKVLIRLYRLRIGCSGGIL